MMLAIGVVSRGQRRPVAVGGGWGLWVLHWGIDCNTHNTRLYSQATHSITHTTHTHNSDNHGMLLYYTLVWLLEMCLLVIESSYI